MNDLSSGEVPNPPQMIQPSVQPPNQPAPLAAFKYATEIREIAKCPVQPNDASIGMAYRFAQADLSDETNYLPTALLQPDRSMPGRKPIAECCVGWSLSMFTTLDALQERARKTLKNSPKFLKRVGDHYTQVKLTSACGVHTGPNNDGHFEFFERSTFDGKKAVVSHGKMKL